MNLAERLWNLSPGSFTRGFKRRWEQRNNPSGWTKVKAGILEGAELFLPPSGPVWVEMIGGFYDSFLYDALMPNHNPKGAVVWDIGAHVGYHSLGFAALGAEVVAFEPNAVNLERFKLNVQRNARLAPRIRSLAVAVSDSDGQVVFKHSDDLRGSSMGGHIDRALPPLDPEVYAGMDQTVVPTVRIDTLVDQRGEKPPDIIKIDVEGAEEMVLRGGLNLLRNRHPVLLMEIHHICLMFSIQKLLADAGYATRLLDQEHATSFRCFIMAEKAAAA